MRNLMRKKLNGIGSQVAINRLERPGVSCAGILPVGTKKIIFLFLFMFAGFFAPHSQAQVFKNIGKKIEKKIEQRADRKVDKTIDKGLDKVEDGIDESTREAGKKSEQSAEAKPAPPPSTSNEGTGSGIMSDDEPYSLKEAETARVNDGLVMVSADCNEFIWFKEGAEMHFETTDFASKKKAVESSMMKVNKVYSEKGKRIAEVNMRSSATEGFEMNMRYICSGNNLYMDISSAMKQALAQSGKENPQTTAALENVEMGFDEGFMDIPKNMYPGQKLDDVSFTIKTSSGSMGMVVNSNLVDRKVGPRETLVTPAGSFQCMPIYGTRKSSMKMMGINSKMGGPTKEIVWMAPGIGVVKSESYDAKGKLASTQVLTKFVR